MKKRQIGIPEALDEIILRIGAEVRNPYNEERSVSEAYRKLLEYAVEQYTKGGE